jgi:hypothetical protein
MGKKCRRNDSKKSKTSTIDGSDDNDNDNDNDNNNNTSAATHDDRSFATISQDCVNSLCEPSSMLGQVGTMGFEESMKSFMAPLKVDDKIRTDILNLPLSSRVYMIDLFSVTQHDNSMSSGYKTQDECQCGLVEKEIGSNGKHWNNSGIGMVECKSDGLSLSLTFSVSIKDGFGTNFNERREMILGTIAKACKAPGALMGPAPSSYPIKPSRPSKILFTSQGLMSSFEDKVKRMGIPFVGVADKKLTASMKSSFSTGMENDRSPDEAMIKAMESVNTTEFPRLYGKDLLNRTKNNETYYVNEERVSLGDWRLDQRNDKATPKEWFARPPPETDSFRTRMLWGWRTNMELATERNDSNKIKDICKRYPSHEVKDFIEMRMLLSTAARWGTAKACRALIKYGKAEVDGVRSKENKRKWIPMQEHTGDTGECKGCTPLFLAVQDGHDAVVRLLIEHGANIQFAPVGSLLHFAVAKGHQNIVNALILAGANLELRDHNGFTPMETCMDFLKWGKNGTKQYSTISKMLKNSDRIKRCAACDMEGPRHHCPCKLESYCNKECQKKMWKEHRNEHKEEIKIWAV